MALGSMRMQQGCPHKVRAGKTSPANNVCMEQQSTKPEHPVPVEGTDWINSNHFLSEALGVTIETFKRELMTLHSILTAFHISFVC